MVVSGEVGGLTANSVYHFRVSATNATGTSVGSDGTFTTQAQEPPEFGRCIAVPAEKVGSKTVFHGGFLAATCLSRSATDTGQYEWSAGARKAAFTLTLTAATAALETVGKTKITCKGGTGTGQYSGRNAVGAVSLQLTGCEQSAKPCTTAGQASGTIRSQTLEGVLGWQTRSLKKVALSLYPVGKSGPFMQFTCAAAGAVTVEGSLLVPDAADKMISSTTLLFKATAGKQKPENFEGAPREVLFASIGGKAREQMGATMTLTQLSEEKVEVNAVI